MIYARLGDAGSYEVVRGARVECGDCDSYDGVPLLIYNDEDEARGFCERLGISVDWSSRSDCHLPSLDGPDRGTNSVPTR
jgi:hypothetical protein